MARRTLARYIDLIRHGLGGTPDSRVNLYEIFNDAGRALFYIAEGPPYYHSWSWIVRDNVPFTIPGDATNTVQEVELPADFDSIVSLEFEDSFVGRVVQVPPETLNRIRRNTPTDPLAVYICFEVGSKQASKDAEPKNVAAFWPPRSSPLTGMRISYRRSWVDMESTDVNAIPDIPAKYERLLEMLSRGYAIHVQDQTDAFEDRAVTAEVQNLVNNDTGRQIYNGQASHSVRASAGRTQFDHSWYGRRITRP